jgi:hypothetical protein
LRDFIFTIREVEHEAIEHGGAFAWSEFWPVFLSATFEN